MKIRPFNNRKSTKGRKHQNLESSSNMIFNRLYNLKKK